VASRAVARDDWRQLSRRELADLDQQIDKNTRCAAGMKRSGVINVRLAGKPFSAFWRGNGTRLFCDEDFAELYSAGRGRPSVWIP